MVESYSKNGNTESLRRSVFSLLDNDPYLTAKTICEMLGLPYKEKYRYLNKLKSDWKSNHENKQGSNCSSVHAWSGCCHVPQYVDRDLALKVGWKPTKAKNHWLLWKDESGIGRMMWFESGRVNLYVTSPVNLGKVKQLVSNGFGFTGLIFSDKVMLQVQETIHHYGSHHVFDVGSPLPKKTVKDFEKSHGITIKIGDMSHPKSVEVEAHVPDWAERLTFSLERIADAFGSSVNEKEPFKKSDYIV